MKVARGSTEGMHLENIFIGQRAVSGKELGTTYAMAFPEAVREAAQYSEDPAARVVSAFALRFLQRFAHPMGLVLRESPSGKKPSPFAEENRYRTTVLFHKIFEWKV